MEPYEKAYYDYQTKARGFLTEQSLTPHFEKLANWYNARLKAFLPRDKKARCLDVPCGFGNFLFYLKKKGYVNVQGVDLDSKQVELAKLMGLPAIEGDAFAVLANAKSSTDLISSIDFIEHLDKNRVLEFLRLTYECLKPGGVLILRAPSGDGPFGAHDAWNDLTHHWGMTADLLNALLEMHGYEQVRILDERPQPSGLINTLRWIIFFPAKLLADGFCIALGMRPPAIWSRSMIAVAHKPKNAAEPVRSES